MLLVSSVSDAVNKLVALLCILDDSHFVRVKKGHWCQIATLKVHQTGET